MEKLSPEVLLEEINEKEDIKVHIKINIPLLTFSTVVLPYFGHADRCKYLMLNLSASTRKLWQTSCEKMIKNHVKRRKLHDSMIPDLSVEKWNKNTKSSIQVLQLYIDHIDSIYLRLLPGIEIVTIKEYNKLFELLQSDKGKYLHFDFIKLHIFNDLDEKGKKAPTIRNEYLKLIAIMESLGINIDCLQEVDPIDFNHIEGINHINHLNIDVYTGIKDIQSYIKDSLKQCNVECNTLVLRLTSDSTKNKYTLK